MSKRQFDWQKISESIESTDLGWFDRVIRNYLKLTGNLRKLNVKWILNRKTWDLCGKIWFLTEFLDSFWRFESFWSTFDVLKVQISTFWKSLKLRIPSKRFFLLEFGANSRRPFTQRVSCFSICLHYLVLKHNKWNCFIKFVNFTTIFIAQASNVNAEKNSQFSTLFMSSRWTRLGLQSNFCAKKQVSCPSLTDPISLAFSLRKKLALYSCWRQQKTAVNWNLLNIAGMFDRLHYSWVRCGAERQLAFAAFIHDL